MVLNESKETQIICDSKIFEENFIVNGNIYTSFINGMNISLEYYSGVQNDEDVKIIGDLVKLFDSDNLHVYIFYNIFKFVYFRFLNQKFKFQKTYPFST